MKATWKLIWILNSISNSNLNLSSNSNSKSISSSIFKLRFTFKFIVKISLKFNFNAKKTGWGGGGGGRGQFDPPCGFSKNGSFKTRVKPMFLGVSNIIIMSHFFSKNFIEIYLVVQKIRRLSQSVLDFSAIFINFSYFWQSKP